MDGPADYAKYNITKFPSSCCRDGGNTTCSATSKTVYKKVKKYLHFWNHGKN
jgi:hypothetical protein